MLVWFKAVVLFNDFVSYIQNLDAKLPYASLIYLRHFFLCGGGVKVRVKCDILT